MVKLNCYKVHCFPEMWPFFLNKCSQFAVNLWLIFRVLEELVLCLPVFSLLLGRRKLSEVLTVIIADCFLTEKFLSLFFFLLFLRERERASVGWG